MKYDEERQIFILKTGKVLARRIVGSLGPPAKTHSISLFDTEERKEIAEYMIELWRAWAE